MAAGLTTTSAAIAYCEDQINRYRATIGLDPLARSAALEDYAAESARIDSAARQPHQHFSRTSGGGIAKAESELLLWSNQTVMAVIDQGLRFMWSEGPSGDHYQILAGPYTEVGCGIFTEANLVTVAQDFR